MSPSSHPSVQLAREAGISPRVSPVLQAAGRLAAPSQSQAAAETPGEWGLAAEGISERWIGWTRLAAVGFNAKSCGSKKKVLN